MKTDRDNLLEHRELLLDAIGVALVELELHKTAEAMKTLEDVRNHIENLILEEEQEAARTQAESLREQEWQDHDPKFDHG